MPGSRLLQLALLFAGALLLLPLSSWIGRVWSLTGPAAQARLVGALLLALLGLFWLGDTTVFRTVRLTCVRDLSDLTVDCQLQHMAYGLIAIRSRQVKDLQSASVAGTAAFDKEGKVLQQYFRVELHGAGGTVPLTPYYTLESAPRAEIVAKIVEFIESGRTGPLVVSDHVTPCADRGCWD